MLELLGLLELEASRHSDRWDESYTIPSNTAAEGSVSDCLVFLLPTYHNGIVVSQGSR